MTSDSDPTGTKGGGRRKGKPTIIDLTAEEVALRPGAPAGADTPEPTADAAQSQPAAGETPASESVAPPAPEPTPAATVDAEAEGLFVAEETAPSEGDAAPSSSEWAATSGSTSDPVTAEPGDAATSGLTVDGTAAGAAPDAVESGDRSDARAETTDDTASPGGSPAAPVSPSPEPARRGPLGALAAAVVGGLVVLAGGAGLYAAGVIGPAEQPAAVSPEAVAALEARIDAVDARVEGLAAAPAPAPAADPALAERVGAIEETVRGLADGGADAALAARLAEIEAQVRSAPPAPPQPAASEPAAAPAVDELRAAVDALTARVESLPPPPADPAPRLDELAAAVAALQTGAGEAKAALDRLAAAPPPVDPARIDALEAGAAEVASRLDAIDDAVAGLRDQLGASIAEVRAAADAGTNAATALGGRLDTIEKRLDEGPKGGEIAALSLAATTLASRVSAGEPFAGDLDVLRAAAPDLPELEPLGPLAAEGVDTYDELLATLPVDAIVAARPVDPDAGVMDRVLSGAKSLVNYRETGTGVDDPASAAIEGIRAALTAGDAAAARTAADGLPDWAKAPAGDWIARLDRRVAADRAVHAITERVLARLKAPAEGQ